MIGILLYKPKPFKTCSVQVILLEFKKKKPNVDDMKAVESARLKRIAKMNFLIAILAYVSPFLVQFQGYIAVFNSNTKTRLNSLVKCSSARNKVVDRIIHDRRDTLFTGRPLTNFSEL